MGNVAPETPNVLVEGSVGSVMSERMDGKGRRRVSGGWRSDKRGRYSPKSTY